MSEPAVSIGQDALGNLNAALAEFTAKRAIIERLAATDPGNAGWQRDLSVMLAAFV